jgi:hypothetical protein
MPIRLHSDRITPGEMRESIRKSGYLVEHRVAKLFRDHHYYVLTNPRYPDLGTGKSREFDIEARTSVQLFPRSLDFLHPVFICECKNNSQPVVFFEAESPIQFLFGQDMRSSGFPVKFFRGERYESLAVFLGLDSFHHYRRGPLSTQFCSFSKKDQNKPWVAVHTEEHYQAFESLVNALETSITLHYDNITLPDSGKDPEADICVYYPLLVLQGEMNLASLGKRGLRLSRIRHVQFRHETWRSGRSFIYQIDVVRESYLPEFLKLVSKEIRQMVEAATRNREVFHGSMKQILADYFENRTSRPPLRRVLEYE